MPAQTLIGLAVVLGGLGSALGLINLVLHGARWNNHMATSPTAQGILADLAQIATDVAALQAKAADASGEADLQEVATQVTALKAALEPAPAA